MTSRSRDFSRLSSRSLTSPGASYNVRRGRSCSPSSRYGACCNPTRGEPARRNFSSSSLTGYGHHAYPKVTINQRLLTPLHLEIDPAFQAIRNKEKEEIKTLNNQFASLIGKVQNLEQHNQVLLTRWNFLREQDNSLSDLDIKLLYDQYMNRLRLEIRSIDNEKEQLDAELDEVLDAMDNVRNSYEEEINKRTGMEFTFTALKKDLDNGFLHKTELEAKLSGLHAWVELMKNIQEQELEEVMSQVKDVSVVLGIDNNRYNPDPHRIVEDVRAQYEALAIRSWEELEALTRSKLNEREVLSVKYGDHLLHDRRAIAELNIQIQKMRSCILSLKSQCLRLEDNIKDVGLQGETALNDAKAKLAKLEEALHNAKQDLAQLVKQYQELMNIKLALDIEILTYRKLMEGEEISMESPPPAVISRIYSTPKLSSPNFCSTTSSYLATRAREDSPDKMSHSRTSLQSGLSRSQSGGTGVVSGDDLSKSHSSRSAGTADGSLSRSHSSMSSSVSEAFRSTSHRGTLESGSSRGTSNKSGNFADIEDTTESSVSRSHSHGSGSHRTHSNKSGDNPEDRPSMSPSSGNRGISESCLSRSQSNRSGGLTDSVFARTDSGTSDGAQESNYSRSQSHRSVGLSPSGFSRIQSEESNIVSGTTHVGDLSSGNSNVPKGNASRSQSSRSRDKSDSSLSRIHSGGSEAISEGSFLGSNSGSSTSYVEGGLSRSQSEEKDFHVSHGSDSYVDPAASKTRNAEEAGVLVDDISRNQSGTSTDISGGSLSRSQSDENEIHGSEDYAEPTVSRSRSAEDGGVPVGGISRHQCGISRDMSTERHLSRSQSDKNKFRANRSSGSYTDSVVSQARSAEDGGVPVGGISRSDRSVEGSLSRCQSGENKFCGTEPVVSRASSTEGVSRIHSSGSRGASQGSSFRTPSIRSADLTDSVFMRTSSNAEQEIQEEPRSRIHSAARESSESSFSRSQSNRSRNFAESVLARTHSGRSEGGLSKSPNDDSQGFVEATAPRSHSHGSGGFAKLSVSTTSNKESRRVSESALSRSPSAGSKDISEDSLSRSQSSRSGGFLRGNSNKSKESDSNVSGRYVDEKSHREADVLKSCISRSRGTSAGRVSRMQSDESEGPVETSTPISLHKRNEGTMEHSLSRSHSEDSESFKATGVSRSASEISKVASEVSPSRSSSKDNESSPEGLLSRNYSYRCAVESHPCISRTESDISEAGGTISDAGLSTSYSSSSGEASINNPYVSYSEEQEGNCQYEDVSHLHTATDEDVLESVETGDLAKGSQSGETATPKPVCMVYEFSSDEDHHPPSGELCYYVETSSME
uniref:IF rod domain-containing protein n=1 Tax=Anolis carolinensis TaxID=28377 RepID=A0A803SQB4_ANOCA|nr:PREDICTED: uncharacterized protein LOC100562605 isoform X1 [Anolis carolinensis]|eukprot:XP_008102289.1 PREDICTED: uncharacterized protein LOC100562605 isoform X1 [Anolis carolinensis]